MPILNYTTSVSAEKTISEIQAGLAKAGAQQITTDYAAGLPVAVAFLINVEHGGRMQLVAFRLPSDVDGVRAALRRARVAPRYQTDQHVRRVAWRIIKDWLEAQLAIIEAGVARPAQVLLPYAVAPDGRTLYEHFEADPSRLLSA